MNNITKVGGFMKRYMMRVIILCFGVLLMLGVTKECQAAKYLDVTAKVKNKTTVELKWKKKSVSGYEIYRATSNKDGDVGAYKKIATVSAKKTKYVDKKAKYKKYYSYKVKAYKKSGSKKTTKFQGDAIAYTGMSKPEWEEYLASDAVTTPISIQLIGYTEGITPSRFVIYRKTGSSGYKKIKTLKGKNGSFVYEDQTVEKGKKYTYKYRTYRTIKGKRLYSKYSSPIKLSAVNKEALYTMQNLTKEGSVKAIIIGLTSGEGNGTTILENNVNYITYHYNKPDGELEYLDMKVVAYSYDNVTWKTFPEAGVKLVENQTVYIQLERLDGKDISFGTTNATSCDIEWWLQYNDKHSILWIDFLNGTAKATVNGEYYH